MSTNCKCVVEPLPRTDDPDDTSDELDHVFCCDLTRALCGAEITSDNVVDEWEDDDLPCVVCADLEFQPVPCSADCPIGVSA